MSNVLSKLLLSEDFVVFPNQKKKKNIFNSGLSKNINEPSDVILNSKPIINISPTLLEL